MSHLRAKLIVPVGDAALHIAQWAHDGSPRNRGGCVQIIHPAEDARRVAAITDGPNDFVVRLKDAGHD